MHFPAWLALERLTFYTVTPQAGYTLSLSLSVTICRMSRWGYMSSEFPGVEWQSLTWERKGGLRYFTLICDATLWLSTRTALGTGKRLCVRRWPRAGSAYPSLPVRLDPMNGITGVFFQVQVPEPLEASSSLEILRVSSHNSLGLPRGLENVSAPITAHLHALPYVCRTMTDGMRPGQDTGDKDGRRWASFPGQTPLTQAMGKVCHCCFQGPGGLNIFKLLIPFISSYNHFFFLMDTL